MKKLLVLFITVLVVGISMPSPVKALQVDCPFPETVCKWNGTEYVASPSPSAPPQIVERIVEVRQQVSPTVIVQTVPTYYPYPYYLGVPYWGWGPYWGSGVGWHGDRRYGPLGIRIGLNLGGRGRRW